MSAYRRCTRRGALVLCFLFCHDTTTETVESFDMASGHYLSLQCHRLAKVTNNRSSCHLSNQRHAFLLPHRNGPTLLHRRPSAFVNCKKLHAKENALEEEDSLFDPKQTLALVGSQTLLLLVSISIASILKIPNYGLGAHFSLSSVAIQKGVLSTLPLFLFAAFLHLVAPYSPQLQRVDKATSKVVLLLLGGRFKPWTALIVSVLLGTVAGFGEEVLFRGILQTQLSALSGDVIAIGGTALIFGALHAITPLYSILAALASLYFGSLYLDSTNLAVPIVCHGLYDIGALLWAHWAVCRDMTDEERLSLVNWNGTTLETD